MMYTINEFNKLDESSRLVVELASEANNFAGRARSHPSRIGSDWR